MTENVKIGDKVWVMVLNVPTQKEVTRIYKFYGGLYLYFKGTDNQKVDFCFSTLESLLQHLKDTAIYCQEEVAA